MKITLGATTLVDDTASPRLAGVVERFSGQSQVEIDDDTYGQADAFEANRGNVKGQIVFTSDCSYGSWAAMNAAADAAYNLLDTKATLVKTYGSGAGSTSTMAGAICRGVERIAKPDDGVRLIIRYTFEITTVVNS